MAAKSALESLMMEYAENSDEEDEITVSGPRVSTKRELDKTSRAEGMPSQKRLPVPSILLRIDDEHTDNPNEHDNRVRSFPHVRGNWATYVYIPISSNPGLDLLSERLKEKLPDLHLHDADEYHISLTKTLILHHHWIEPFVESVKRKASSVTRFAVWYDNLEIYSNEEKTRTFIGLKIKANYHLLKKLTESMDECCRDFKLPEFYEDPSFHVSFLWCTGDHSEHLKNLLPELKEIFMDTAGNTLHHNWYQQVIEIRIKTGNKTFSFMLPRGESLFG